MAQKGIEFGPPGTAYDDTVSHLQQRFSPKQSTIYARAQFNRRLQSSHETSLDFVTILRSLASKCNYSDDMRDELIRDRFVAGCCNDRIRERLLLENDNMTLEQALTLAQTFERATSESSKVGNTKSSDSIQSIRRSSFSN